MGYGIPTVRTLLILLASLTIVDHKMADTRVNNELSRPRSAEQQKVMVDFIHPLDGKKRLG